MESSPNQPFSQEISAGPSRRCAESKAHPRQRRSISIPVPLAVLGQRRSPHNSPCTPRWSAWSNKHGQLTDHLWDKGSETSQLTCGTVLPSTAHRLQGHSSSLAHVNDSGTSQLVSGSCQRNLTTHLWIKHTAHFWHMSAQAHSSSPAQAHSSSLTQVSETSQLIFGSSMHSGDFILGSPIPGNQHC